MSKLHTLLFKKRIRLWIMKTQGRITLSLWSWRVSLEPFYKISQDIKYHVISYLSLSFINLNIS